MRDDINMRPSRHSGDINFVAALMSQGIPLDREFPCRLVESERGTYTSFRYASVSDDGRLSVDPLVRHWSGTELLPSTHGFAEVCAFIKSRPRGVHHSTELLDFAIDYLTERGDKLPGLSRFEDIPDFIKALPHARASYVLAYIWNREVCFQLHRTARRSVYLNDDDKHAIIDQRLPKWQRDELLSRYND